MTTTTILPTKIISGGQTGADRAGLDFAIARGLVHGGWCPAGRRSEDGRIPVHYQLQETKEWGYKARTQQNVRDSDATLIFNPHDRLSAGSALTLRSCEEQQKPCLILRGFGLDQSWVEPLAGKVIGFLSKYRPATLNIAGNREESQPGLGDFVGRVLDTTWINVLVKGQTVPVSNQVQGAKMPPVVRPAKPDQTEFLGELFTRPSRSGGAAFHR